MSVKKKTKLTLEEKLLYLKSNKIDWTYSNQKGEKRYVAYDCKDPQVIRVLGYFRTMGEMLKHFFNGPWFADDRAVNSADTGANSERDERPTR